MSSKNRLDAVLEEIALHNARLEKGIANCESIIDDPSRYDFHDPGLGVISGKNLTSEYINLMGQFNNNMYKRLLLTTEQGMTIERFYLTRDFETNQIVIASVATPKNICGKRQLIFNDREIDISRDHLYEIDPNSEVAMTYSIIACNGRSFELDSFIFESIIHKP